MPTTTTQTRTPSPGRQQAAANARAARARKALERQLAAAEALLRDNGYAVAAPEARRE